MSYFVSCILYSDMQMAASEDIQVLKGMFDQFGGGEAGA